jgi:hypothetical protein
MKRSDDIDDPRRRLLIQALATGVFAAGLPGSTALAASIFGSKPTKLPENKSIYRLSGQVTVNDKVATLDTPIKPGDVVKTGKNSEIIFVINGNNSMILRNDSHLVITEQKKTEPQQAEPKKTKTEPKKKESNKSGGKIAEPKVSEPEISLISSLSLLAGRLLSVSRDTNMKVQTITATIGIRGTGFYVTSDPEQTYFCTCYGLTDVTSNFNPDSKETIKADHHDKPVYIVKDVNGNNIRKAPLVDHTDQELTLIEALVGRTTPFVFANDEYSSPRRDY